MENLVDFSELRFDKAGYGGSDEKYNDVWNGSWYMFKFGEKLEPDPKKPMQASYENAPLSEHLCCNIFRALGIPTQETILGTYQGRSVVACKDFIRNQSDKVLLEYAQLERSTPGGSSVNKRTPEYAFTLKVLDENPWLAPIRTEAKRRFWQTLCVDALIGNFDRHSGNWGYIADTESYSAVECAPVYDCGSGLYPRLSEREMEHLLDNPERLRERITTFPNVRLLINGKRPHYQEFLVSDKGRPARIALNELWNRIDLDCINSIFDSCPAVDSVRREFFSTLIKARYEVILKPAYDLSVMEEREFSPSVQELISESLRASELENQGEHGVTKGGIPGHGDE